MPVEWIACGLADTSVNVIVVILWIIVLIVGIFTIHKWKIKLQNSHDTVNTIIKTLTIIFFIGFVIGSVLGCSYSALWCYFCFQHFNESNINVNKLSNITEVSHLIAASATLMYGIAISTMNLIYLARLYIPIKHILY